jgi:hypothetical protein
LFGKGWGFIGDIGLNFEYRIHANDNMNRFYVGKSHGESGAFDA